MNLIRDICIYKIYKDIGEKSKFLDKVIKYNILYKVIKSNIINLFYLNEATRE